MNLSKNDLSENELFRKNGPIRNETKNSPAKQI